MKSILYKPNQCIKLSLLSRVNKLNNLSVFADWPHSTGPQILWCQARASWRSSSHRQRVARKSIMSFTSSQMAAGSPWGCSTRMRPSQILRIAASSTRWKGATHFISGINASRDVLGQKWLSIGGKSIPDLQYLLLIVQYSKTVIKCVCGAVLLYQNWLLIYRLNIYDPIQQKVHLVYFWENLDFCII